MGRWFCFGKKDFCDDVENCSSCKFANWEGSVNEDEISLVLSKIFGEDYGLDRLDDLVKADRNHLLKEQKTQTNADKIRSMTDEELAVFLDEFSGRCMDCEKLGPDTGCPIYKGGVFCLPCDVMDWLKQPAKE